MTNNVYFIENGFDGFKQIKNVYISVENGLITNITKVKETEQFVSFKNKFVTPAFIDCHIHLFSSSIKEINMNNPIEVSYLGLTNAVDLLKQGFTYVRDCGAPNDTSLQLKELIKKEQLNACDIVVSGQPLCITGGHGYTMSMQVDGVEEVRKAIRMNIMKNVDFIKLMVTTGVNSRGNEMAPSEFTFEEIEIAVKTAHNHGRKVAVHTHGYTGIKNSLLAGVDSIEHGVCLSEDLIPLMIKNNTFLVPTLSAPYFAATCAIMEDPNNPDHKKSKEVIQLHNKNILNAYKKGVKLAYGTDCGTPYNQHKENLQECKLLHNIGIDSKTILKMLTSNASECCGLENVGSIQVGKSFDIIVHQDNLITNIDSITNKKIVYKNGKRVR